MSGQVPFGLEMGEPRTSPMDAFLSDHAREVTGEIYTVNGGSGRGVGPQPAEVRATCARTGGGPWTSLQPGSTKSARNQPILAAGLR